MTNNSKGTLGLRLKKSFGANMFGQLISVGLQLVSIPFFLHYWSLEQYGIWVLVSAIPAYLSLTDLGVSSVAGNQMLTAIAESDEPAAARVFQSSWILLTSVSSCIVLLFLAYFYFSESGPSGITSTDFHTCIFILSLSVAISLQIGLIGSVFRACYKYAEGTMLVNGIRIAEFIIPAVLIVLGGKLVEAAYGILVARILGLIVMSCVFRKFAPWAQWGHKSASKREMRGLIRPALSFTAIPIANALTLQGTTVIIGYLLGPVALVTFTTTRTVVRLLPQLLNSLNMAVWPEMTLAFADKNEALIKTLHRRSFAVAMYASVSCFIFLVLAGPTVIRYWTNDSVSVDSRVFALLLGGVVINAMWYTSSVVHVSINRHGKLTIYLILAGLLGCVGSLLSATEYGLSGPAVSLLLGEILVASYVFPKSLRLTGDSWASFVSSVVTSSPIKRR